jgi:hypothetical protein
MNMYTDSVGGQYAGDGMALEAGLYFSQGFRLSPWALLALTLVQVIVAGGTIFGWQALLPVLYETGVYAQSCPGGMDDPEYPCLEQRTKLTLVFSVAVPPRNRISAHAASIPTRNRSWERARASSLALEARAAPLRVLLSSCTAR